MTDNKAFTAAVNGWGDLTLAKMRRVAQASALDVFNDAQQPVAKGGSMPVDTGNLRNSLVVELNGVRVGEGADSYTLAITGFDIGDYVTGAWAAPYARARHYKPPDFGQGGGMWRDRAAAKWQSIVARNVKKAQQA